MSPTESGAGPAPADAAAVADQPEPSATDDAVVAGAPELIANSVGEYARIWIKRVRNGESGALPIMLGLLAIVIFFQVRSSLFLSAGNLVNLMIQGVPFILLGMAEVFVLLLGETKGGTRGFTGPTSASMNGSVFSSPGSSSSSTGAFPRLTQLVADDDVEPRSRAAAPRRRTPLRNSNQLLVDFTMTVRIDALAHAIPAS